MKPISEQVVLITGASRGIGKAIALRLAEEGAKLALVARDADRLHALVAEIEAGGGRAVAYPADVTDRVKAKEIVTACENHLGSIDLLVNNAGAGGDAGPIWESDIERVWDAFAINTRGPMIYTHAILPFMVARQSGLILNMGSYASIRPIPFSPGYAASKAALARFSDSVAASTEEHGVSVLTLSPGLVETDMTRDSEYFKDVPPDNWSPIEDICELVANLAGRDCSPLNGALIHVKDDLETLFENADRIQENCLYSLRLYGFDGLVD